MKVIDPHVKSRVIELFQAKKEYKEIVEILKAEGIKVSFGSCWNIVSQWKGANKVDQKNQGREPPNHLGHSGYFKIGNVYRLPFDNSTEPMLVLASGQTSVSLNQNSLNNTSINPTTISIPNDISNNVDHSTSSHGVEMVDNSDQEIDFADQEYETSEALLSGEYNPALDGEQGERLLGFEHVDIEHAQNHNRVIEETSEIKESTATTESNQSQSGLSEPKDTSSLVEEPELNIGMNWDAPNNYQSRFMKSVWEEKRQMRIKRNELDNGWNELQAERKKFADYTEMKEKDLQIREATLAQVKDLISTAAELKEFGLDFDIANSWLSCVKEMSLRKGLDMRQAAWKLAEDLKNWQELGGFETAIQNAKHQLELLNIAVEDKKQALGTIIDLRKSGMTENNIMNLTRVVNGWGNGNSGFKLDTTINGHKETIDNVEDNNN